MQAQYAVSRDEPVAVEPERAVWPVPLRIAFRFVFSYLVLYNLPDPPGRINLIDSLPGGSFLSQWYAKPWHALVPWVATHLFHVTGRAATYFPTGSGDTTKDFVLEFCFLVIALVATVIWSIFDRKRENYHTLYCWLRWLVRYTLAFTLFGYGFAKVFPLQFGTPNLARLLERYGDFSPMGSLWWFMGASLPYIIFAGTAEVLPGILLLFRRTATLGAMVAFAVLSNVMVLNYSYDVPVKLYSTNLVLMSLFLIAPDLRRLARVLIQNQPTQPADLYPLGFTRNSLGFTQKWMRVTAMAIAILVPGYVLGQQVYGGLQATIRCGEAGALWTLRSRDILAEWRGCPRVDERQDALAMADDRVRGFRVDAIDDRGHYVLQSPARCVELSNQVDREERSEERIIAALFQARRRSSATGE